MRRRDAESALPRDLSPAALPEYVDDLSLSPKERQRRWDAWFDRYEDWRRRRARWAAARGIDPRTLPGHDLRLPDGPFDPDQV